MNPVLNSAFNPCQENKSEGHVPTISPAPTPFNKRGKALSGGAQAIINTLRRLEKLRSLKRLNAYIGSTAYQEAHAKLPLNDIVRVSGVLTEVHGKLWRPEGRIPIPGSVRVRWTAEYKAMFIATCRSLGDDLLVAHRLKLPLDTVRRARLRHLGRVQDAVTVAQAA